MQRLQIREFLYRCFIFDARLPFMCKWIVLIDAQRQTEKCTNNCALFDFARNISMLYSLSFCNY